MEDGQMQISKVVQHHQYYKRYKMKVDRLAEIDLLIASFSREAAELKSFFKNKASESYYKRFSGTHNIVVVSSHTITEPIDPRKFRKAVDNEVFMKCIAVKIPAAREALATRPAMLKTLIKSKTNRYGTVRIE